MIRKSVIYFGAYCALALLVLPAAVVQATDIVQYSFPSSWDGVGAAPQVVTDLSPAGNNGMTTGGAATSANVPPGAPAGAMSLNTSGEGGVMTDAINLLDNPAVEAAGGFALRTWFYWDGNDGNRGVQKIIDNEGFESLQLINIDAAANTADLEFILNDAAGIGPTLPIVANTWYDAWAIFDSQGNTIDGIGDLAGLATVKANAASASTAVTRTTASDGQDRPIAFGVLALPAVPTLVNFSGDIYNPTVALVPEPSSIAIALLAMAGVCVRRRRL